MKILLLDNYDSFTYNIYHVVRELGYECDIFRNDKITIDEVGKYDKIILSPGPGIPSEAGILLEVIKTYAPSKSILGICLGEQAIAEAFGGELTNLSQVYHGVESQICVTAQDSLFEGLEHNFQVGRYHSWIVNRASLPAEIEVIAEDCEKREIMALRHKKYDVKGVQFHPESVLTPNGKTIISNFLRS